MAIPTGNTLIAKKQRYRSFYLQVLKELEKITIG
jgi:hypothetical protein